MNDNKITFSIELQNLPENNWEYIVFHELNQVPLTEVISCLLVSKIFDVKLYWDGQYFRATDPTEIESSMNKVEEKLNG